MQMQMSDPTYTDKNGNHIDLEVSIEKKNTLNNRYQHGGNHTKIPTEAVMLQDDDIIVCPAGLRAGIASFDPNRVSAFFIRTHEDKPSHDDYGSRRWQYRIIHEDSEKWHLPFSMSTGQANIVHRQHMERFWASDQFQEARDFIDNNKPTCEDLSLNFLVANTTGYPPLFLDINKIKMQTDAKSEKWNKFKCFRQMVKSDMVHHHEFKGLSRSVKGWKSKRSNCIDRLEKLFGHMPLKKTCDRVRYCDVAHDISTDRVHNIYDIDMSQVDVPRSHR